MNSAKKIFILVLAAAMVLAALAVVIVSQKQLSTNTEPWYGRYWEYSEQAEKLVRIEGDKVYLDGKWENSSEQYGDVKPKKINKVFTLTDDTKYYFNDTNAEKDPLKEVTREEFEESLYTDLCYCSFKVEKGKVLEAYLAFN